jgi:hypothetical protein
MFKTILSAIACLGIGGSAFAQARIVITEIMYNPASNERKNETEWIEIANVGNETAEIKEWRLAVKDKKSRFGKFSCTLAPGGVAVIINGEAVKEEQFREAWNITSESESAAPVLNYQVIAVKWGGLPNNAESAVQLLNEKDEVVYVQAGVWPRIAGAGGPSILLTDVNATEETKDAWRISVVNIDGARHNKITDGFDKQDVGSPGYVPGINGNPAATTPVTVSKRERAKPDDKGEPSQEPQPRDNPKDDTIDY